MILEDSTTYQFVLQKGIAQGIAQGVEQGVAQGVAQGRVEATQSLIQRQGTKRFGQASPAIVAAIRAITDHDLLERLTDRVLDATGWDDLLATS